MGSGAFGKVYIAKSKLTEEVVAVKILFKNLVEQKDASKYLSSEVAIVQKQNHVNCIKFKSFIGQPIVNSSFVIDILACFFKVRVISF